MSNQGFTLGEFNEYRKACKIQGVTAFLPREKIKERIERREQILNGTMGSDELDAAVKRRIEENIRQGHFSAISNIPYELSRLQHEIESLRAKIQGQSEAGRLVNKRSSTLGLEELKKRLDTTIELHARLN